MILRLLRTGPSKVDRNTERVPLLGTHIEQYEDTLGRLFLLEVHNISITFQCRL